MNPRNRLLPFSILLVLIVTLMPGNGQIAGNYLDKVAHFVIFFILTINIIYKYKEDKRLAGLLLWAAMGGLLTELAQQLIPGRNMDMYDAIADTLGIICAYYLYFKKTIAIERLLVKFGA